MLEKSIAWFNARKGKVTYSMTSRRGPSSYDCSSAVYYSLIEAGVFPSTIFIGNTDTLYNDLTRHGYTKAIEQASGFIPSSRGDIFLWGKQGASGGAFGHTGEFIDNDNIIHCSFGYNGIAISNHDWLWGINGKPPVTIYHYTGTPAPTAPSGSPTDQIVEVGSWVRFNQAYTANDVQFVSNTWQVRTDQLCTTGFTWADNGIPAGLLTEVDNEGYATADQELAIGSQYKIAGKFIVLDIGQVGSEWFAQVGAGGLTFWVDIETATEVTGSDAGTPVPVQKAPVVVVPPVIDPAIEIARLKALADAKLAADIELARLAALKAQADLEALNTADNTAFTSWLKNIFEIVSKFLTSWRK